jgi:hypothetical protein
VERVDQQKTSVIARCQQAKSWELRAAMGLARLWLQQGEQAEAYQLLAPISSWFTEGLATPDLREARALLTAIDDTLASTSKLDRTQLRLCLVWDQRPIFIGPKANGPHTVPSATVCQPAGCSCSTCILPHTTGGHKTCVREGKGHL